MSNHDTPTPTTAHKPEDAIATFELGTGDTLLRFKDGMYGLIFELSFPSANFCNYLNNLELDLIKFNAALSTNQEGVKISQLLENVSKMHKEFNECG